MATPLIDENNLSDVPNKGLARVNLLVDPSSNYLDADCKTAFDDGYALNYDGPGDIFLNLNIQSSAATDALRMAYFKAALDWQAKCQFSGAGRIGIKLTKGMHSVQGGYIRNGWQSDLLLVAAALEPDKSRTITGIVISGSGAGVREMTISVSSALPTHVVPGYPIGLQNVVSAGSDSAAACTGAVIVKTVATGRMSFTADHYFAKTPTEPITINSSAHSVASPDPYQLDRSVVVIPDSALRVTPNSDWNGTTEGKEGFFNLYRGAKMFTSGLGISYSGVAGARDLFMISDVGSYLEDRYNSVFVGADNSGYVVRMFAGAQIYLNRTCLGGGAEAQSGICTQDFNGYRGFRISMGGFTQYGVLSSQGGNGNGTGIISSCKWGIGVQDGSTFTPDNVTITGCDTCFTVEGGAVYGGAMTRLRDSLNAMAYRKGGRLYGDFSIIGVTTVAPADLEFGNGVWSKSEGNSPRFKSIGVRSEGASSSASVVVESDGVASLQVHRYSTDNTAPQLDYRKARGTRAAPSIIATNDPLLQIVARGFGATAFQNAAVITVSAIDTAPSDSAMGGRVNFALSPVGSQAAAEVLRLEHGTGLSMYGANVVVDNNRHFRLRAYTYAALPSASVASGQMIFCSDLGGGGGPLYSDGTVWRRAGRPGLQEIATDTSFSVNQLVYSDEILHTGTLTANRTITLGTTNVYHGATWRFTRTGGGAFSLSIGGLYNLTSGTWGRVTYNSTAGAFFRSGTGTV